MSRSGHSSFGRELVEAQIRMRHATMRRPTCICGMQMASVPNVDIYRCERCGIEVTGLELCDGVDPRSLLIQTVRSWWKHQGVSL
jgi:hypothetical protein